jgi:hypothetical protein
MSRIRLEPDDDAGFWAHAKVTFNHKFHAMNMDLHCLALFLHPLCRKLAVSNAAKGRPFSKICAIAVHITRQWRWTVAEVGQLIDDMQLYYQCKAPFAGSHVKAAEYWGQIDIKASEHPLKTLGVVITAIVPHSANVERLFSDLGGVEGVHCCNLSVSTFETLGKLHPHSAQS